MGLCWSSLSEAERLEIEASAKLDRELETGKIKEKKVIKILLLGTGESGKSTVFKQMQLLYTSGFNEQARLNFRNVVRKNVVESMQQIISAVERFEWEFDTSEAKASAEFIKALDSFSVGKDLSGLAKHINILWKSSDTIRKAYSNRNKFYVNDSAEYYFDRIDKLTSADYLPDDQDILRARLRTTGITESVFKIEGIDFMFIDVGGQRNERKKWIHSFAEVTTILFIAAISEYDQTLFEDEKTNRMLESLEVFGQIANNEYFKDTPIILFLNKIDVFHDKIAKKIDPSICFPDYKDGPNPDKAAEFIEGKFLSQVENKDKDVFAHFTTAIDTKNVERVWTACRGIILRRCLTESGLRF